MQELLLYSQIPATRHDQVRHILAGVTASPPTQITEQHLVYQQIRMPERNTSKKNAQPQQQNVQQQRPTYHKLIREVDLKTGQPTGPWQFRAEEIPQAGVSIAVSRAVDERVLAEGELENFREGGQWYRYVSPRIKLFGLYFYITITNNCRYVTQYIAPTTRFVHHNIIVNISRPYSLPEGHGALEPLDAPILPLSDCKPVDPSGAYVFIASIRIEDGKNSKLTEQAMAELLGFKKQMEGAVDLRLPERLSLDSRVKNV
ncbi:hypothetical protein D0863_00969 [Hortaea werneckii]|uniref:Mediator of RNA polymerase II transcription subunit 18 n=1 Tax=Hortaea werneckii TaxID=91943 RepID=A0A3M7EPG7_HORWE|nr:hypothetical protein D0863_00969 [Hortaea werneckii]